MKKRFIDAQIINTYTYLSYLDQCTMIASNVFNFINIPESIDINYVNNCLLKFGMVAFFKDEVMDEVLALPFYTNYTRDVYGRPTFIEVYSPNGTYHRKLKRSEFIVMYDNSLRKSLFYIVNEYAKRLAIKERIIDINDLNVKNIVIWKTSQENEYSLKRVLNNIDANVNAIITYDNIELQPTESLPANFQYYGSELHDSKDKVWNEFLRIFGISNVSFSKKERLIADEVVYSQGGTIASRFTRYNPRLDAINKINQKWGLDIKIEYYDGLPTNLKEPEEPKVQVFNENNENEGDDPNV